MLMRIARKAFLSGMVLMPALLVAAPVPKIDADSLDMGVIKEEHATTVKHTFKIKNIGDSTLKLTWVRAHCGCTAVAYDSIVQPGKTGTLIAEINPQGFAEGPFEKSISVGFNNEKFSQTNLVMKGVWRHQVTVVPDQVQFSSNSKDSVVTLTLATDQKNFSVLGVSFQINQDAFMTWQTSIPMNFSFAKATAADRKSDPEWLANAPAYRLTVKYVSDGKQDRYGQLIIKTNIPGKPEISVSGVLQGRRR